MKKFTSIDLFAGAGGFSLGLEWAGIAPVYALEHDRWAAETYRANNPVVALDVRDIREINDDEIARFPYRPDVIVGGPPCQGFSHANAAGRDPKDPRNSLFRDFIRFARILTPAICLVENVPGLLKTKMADGRPAIDAIRDEFAAIGYRSDWAVLDAADFGVPQHRERLFIVASRLEGLDFSKFWPKSTHRQPGVHQQSGLFAEVATEPYVTLWDAISDLPHAGIEGPESSYLHAPANEFQRQMREREPRTLSNHVAMRHTARVVERFKSIAVGQSEADVPEHLKPRKRGAPDQLSGSVYDQNSRRQDPARPCNAMVASAHTNFVHPYLHRNFTVREMMRIQSFPDWFVVHGKRAVLSKKLSIKKGLLDEIYLDQRAQIGNAVPPLLGMVLGFSVVAMLQSQTEGVGGVAQVA